jgi:glycosyltransferase involved in cell wall biosynthesis
MRVLTVSTVVPFVVGGGELIVDWLDKTLQKYGYESELIKIPFRSYPPEMLEQMLALRLMDLTDHADVLIAIRTPSYIVKHPNKVVWFIHHHRGAYDLWGTKYQDIPATHEGLQVRESIIQADNIFLREARKIFTNSQVTSSRLKQFNDLDAEVLYPPLFNSELYHCNEYGNYIFYPSRINNHKRQHLAVQSMHYTKSNVTLLIAGSPDSMDHAENLKSMISGYNLGNRVKFIDRWISDQEKVKFFSNALACLYVPYDEDSYGYVSLEAFHSKKSVITCDDSGGTLELVEDGVNGFVVPPEPRAIAEVMDRLYRNKKLAKELGEAGLEKLSLSGITWDNVIQKLLK